MSATATTSKRDLWVYVYMSADRRYMTARGSTLDEARRRVCRRWRAKHGRVAPASASYCRHEDPAAARREAIRVCRSMLIAESMPLM